MKKILVIDDETSFRAAVAATLHREGYAVNHKRLLRIEPVTAAKIRLRIAESPVCPALANLGLYLEPGR